MIIKETFAHNKRFYYRENLKNLWIEDETWILNKKLFSENISKVNFVDEINKLENNFGGNRSKLI